jgi:predicted small secreted protein
MEDGERPVRHWLLLGAGLLILAGCGTVEGLGKDISDMARWSRGQISR